MHLSERIRALPLFEPKRVTEGDERFYDTPVGQVPSVTNILSNSRDNSGLEQWRESIGVEKADEIRDMGAFRGSRHHLSIERFFVDRVEPAFDFLNTPYWKSSRPFLDTVDTPLLCEGAVWHNEGYAGTLDCIAYLQDDNEQPTLLDWKTANSRCKPNKLYDYTLQCAAYVAAANHVYGHLGLNITRACIVVAIPDEPAQVEFIDENALRQLFRHFLARKSRYAYARSRR